MKTVPDQLNSGVVVMKSIHNRIATPQAIPISNPPTIGCLRSHLAFAAGVSGPFTVAIVGNKVPLPITIPRLQFSIRSPWSGSS